MKTIQIDYPPQSGRAPDIICPVPASRWRWLNESITNLISRWLFAGADTPALVTGGGQALELMRSIAESCPRADGKPGGFHLGTLLEPSADWAQIEELFFGDASKLTVARNAEGGPIIEIDPSGSGAATLLALNHIDTQKKIIQILAAIHLSQGRNQTEQSG